MTKRSIGYSMRSSLWFVPVLMFASSVAAALGLVELDLWLDAQNLKGIPEALSAGPDGARNILSVIASSTITVAGVIFSVTIVTLSLAAAQYSPRVLRSFMRDRLNQSVLGVLVAVFTYSLLVLRAIRSVNEPFVPQLSLWTGILLVLVAIGFFIAFIHHTAMSIQAPEIVARIARETLVALKAVREMSHKDEAADLRAALPTEKELEDVSWQSVPSPESGYVQDVNIEALFELACERKVILRVERTIGEFTVAGRPLVSLGNGAPLEKTLLRTIQKQFAIESYRTVDQDPAFGIRQLVDIALKALAPSSNDTTTAVHCVDYLSVILHQTIQGPPLPQTHTRRAKLRLIVERPQTTHLLDLSLNEIRQSAQGNVAVLLRMLRLTRQLREDIQDPGLRRHVQKHIALISENIERYVVAAPDRDLLHRSAAQALDTAFHQS